MKINYQLSISDLRTLIAARHGVMPAQVSVLISHSQADRNMGTDYSISVSVDGVEIKGPLPSAPANLSTGN